MTRLELPQVAAFDLTTGVRICPTADNQTAQGIPPLTEDEAMHMAVEAVREVRAGRRAAEQRRPEQG